MSKAPKSVSVIESEKKSHRTKSELNLRKEGEKALLSGKTLTARPEVRNNPDAYKEFKRVNALLKLIGKNDAIYENVINRYCVICAECSDFESKISKNNSELTSMQTSRDDGELTVENYYKLRQGIENVILSLDRQLQTKRKMLFDIEKENGLTVASALRNIPKKEEKASDELDGVLNDG